MTAMNTRAIWSHVCISVLRNGATRQPCRHQSMVDELGRWSCAWILMAQVLVLCFYLAKRKSFSRPELEHVCSCRMQLGGPDYDDTRLSLLTDPFWLKQKDALFFKNRNFADDRPDSVPPADIFQRYVEYILLVRTWHICEDC